VVGRIDVRRSTEAPRRADDRVGPTRLGLMIHRGAAASGPSGLVFHVSPRDAADDSARADCVGWRGRQPGGPGIRNPSVDHADSRGRENLGLIRVSRRHLRIGVLIRRRGRPGL
jgi:hypothetical protein